MSTSSMASAAPPRSSKALKVLVVIGLIVSVLGFLLLSTSPSVVTTTPPNARTVGTARTALRQLTNTPSGSSSRAELHINDDEAKAVAALISHATDRMRFAADISNDKITMRSSAPLPGGIWLNSSAAVSGASGGFPDLELTVGQLRVPKILARPLAELARYILRLRGADLPPLDSMVQQVTVRGNELHAQLNLPAGKSAARALLQPDAILDNEVVVQVFCRLEKFQQQKPDNSLATHVRRAFSLPIHGEAESHNRAALVALAMFTVGKRAEQLAAEAAKQAKRCNTSHHDPTLKGRADLAKHWALSAALGAMIGPRAANSLGEWKELSDSLPAGSGFSFVNLAADRSGLAFARRAVDPQSAAATARALTQVTEEQLLPIGLLAAEEGLSETQFIARFGTIDSKGYSAALTRIDRQLDRLVIK